MKTFEEIEQKYGSSPVVTDEPDFIGSGTLILDGRKTQAVLQSKQSLMGRPGDDGWFSLRLKGANGRPILLHNALLTRSIQHGFGGENHEDHIYPNAVILGSDALVDGSRIKSLAFTVRDASLFFHYQHVESQSLYNAPKELLQVLRKIGRGRETSRDLFKPRDLFIIHQFPRVLQFDLGNCQYEVFVGSRQAGRGWENIDFQTDPIATITFKEPASIEDAINAAWKWKRFFTTIALRPLSWTSLTAMSGRGRSTRTAEVYLPTHAEDGGEKPEARAPFSLWLGNIPLNRWRERHTLAAVMKSWLSKEAERERFRGSIENAAKRMRQSVSVDTIVTLCAGIESLDELKVKSGITAAQTKLLAKGAIAAAKEHGIEIEDQRLRGLLGSLQNESLAQRLKRMFIALEPEITSTQADVLIKSVWKLRQIAAHGVTPATEVMPEAVPAIEGLACACALYDLVTCGMPFKNRNEYQIGLLQHLSSMIFELEHIRKITPQI